MGIFVQRGVTSNQKGFYHKKTENISELFVKKGGGGLANSKISLSEKTGASKLLEGGVSEFQSFSEEKKTVFFYASPTS